MKRFFSFFSLSLFAAVLFTPAPAQAELDFQVKAWTFKDNNRCVCCGATKSKLIRSRTVTVGSFTHTFKTYNTDWSQRCSESPPVGGAVFVYASIDGGSYTLLDRFEADINATDGRTVGISGDPSQVRLRIEAYPYAGCNLKWFADDSRNLGSGNPLYYTINAANSGESLKVYFNC